MSKKVSQISKKSKMIAATAFVLGLAALGTGYVHAQGTDTQNRPMEALTTAIAQKFNLNATEVQVVVDEVMKTQREERQANREQGMKDRLTQAVADGKITQAQADLLIAKQTEMHAFMQSMQGKTDAERKDAMQAKMEEMKQWMTDNNIPEQFAHGGIGERRSGQHGGMPMMK